METTTNQIVELNDKFNFSQPMTIKEQYEFAKEKAKLLPAGQQIRLTAEKSSYTLINIVGIVYIGSFNYEPKKPMFKNRTLYTLTYNESKDKGTFQLLYKY